MSREIKFRAWDKAHKKMSYKVNLYSLNQSGEMNSVQIDGQQVMKTIGFHADIMQFTGLHDKNGIEIYEGDIVVKIEDDHEGAIEKYGDPEYWPDDFKYDLIETNRDFVTLENFGFWLKNEGFGWEGEDLQESKQYEVIGNIYQNPELLNNQQ